MFDEAIKKIYDSNKIYISGHINPDGDSIGSTFGLYLALKSIGKDVTPILKEHSQTFSFLDELKCSKSVVEEDEYDLLICVDSSTKERLVISEEDYSKAKCVILIDHHISDSPYGDINVIDSTIPAASQIVYDLLCNMNVEISKDVAKYLYMGIVTDTGSFNYTSTRPSTLVAASKLMETGIEFDDICKRVNDTISEKKLYLIKKTIENMEVFNDGKIRYSFIDYKIMEEIGIDDEDAEGMVNYLRAVEKTEVAIYVREKQDGQIKVSMRSAGKVDLAQVAIFFGGGGHRNAAGYTMNLENSSYIDEKNKLLEFIGERL